MDIFSLGWGKDNNIYITFYIIIMNVRLYVVLLSNVSNIESSHWDWTRHNNNSNNNNNYYYYYY